jgi:hypothetical protein
MVSFIIIGRTGAFAIFLQMSIISGLKQFEKCWHDYYLWTQRFSGALCSLLKDKSESTRLLHFVEAGEVAQLSFLLNDK